MNKSALAALAAVVAAGVIVAISITDARGPLGFFGVNGASGSCSDALSGQKRFKTRKAGTPAPDISVIDGATDTEVRLADYKGKGLIVNFWATWCGPCVREMPDLLKLKQSAPAGVEVLAVSVDRGGIEVVEPFLAKNDWTELGMLLDTKSKLLRGFAAPTLPTTILIAPDGTEAARYVGVAEWNSDDVRAIIDACIAPKPS